MVDNLAIIDGGSVSRALATKDLGNNVHLPKHILADEAGATVSPATQATLASVLAALLDLAPAAGAISVTPSDTTVLANVRSLKIGTGGTIVVTIGGSDFTFTVSDGETLPVKATKVKATGTTATGIVALT